MRWPLGTAAVVGVSMSPTLRPGDFLLLRYGARPRPGAVVVVRRPDRPDLLVVKRATRPVGGDRWWVVGDNPSASDDSRLFGPVDGDDIRAVVVARYWPPGRAGVVRR